MAPNSTIAPAHGPRPYPLEHGRAGPRRAADQYDTSKPEALRAAAAFVKGWLESRDIEVRRPRLRRPARSSWPTSAPRTGPTVILHGHLDVVPAPRGPVRAARRGRPAHRPRRLRHEGRARVDDVRGPRRGRAGPGPRDASSACPTRSPRTSTTARPTRSSREGLRARLRDHRRADRPPHRRPGEGRARGPRRGTRDGRARLDAVARRQRDPQGPRRVPPHRDAAVQPRVVGPVRPARRSTSPASRAATRSTRCPDRCCDGRRHPLPAQPGPGRHPRPDPRDPRHARSSRRSRARPRSSRASNPYVLALRDAVGRSIEGEALSVGRDGASRRHLVPRGRRPGGRVRPDRRRPPRPAGVGLDLLAGALPPGARRLRPPPAGLAGAPGPAAAGAGRRARVARARVGSRAPDGEHHLWCSRSPTKAAGPAGRC